MNVSWESEFKTLATRYGDRVAISCGSLSVNFKAVFDHAAGIADHLAGLGVGPGMPVAAMIPNSIAAVCGSLGITLSGATEVPINPALSPAEREWCLSLAQAKHLLTIEDFDYAGVSNSIERHHADKIAPSDIAKGHWTSPTADHWSRILFTSGTTGRPKGVVHTQQARWLANLLLVSSLSSRPGPDDQILLMTPFSHGASLMTYAFFTSGAPIHIVNGVQLDEVLPVIRGGSVRHIFAPPTVLSKLVAALNGDKISSVTTIFTGTAPLSGKLYKAARDVFGPIVRITFGMTEMFNPITVLEPAACEAIYRAGGEDAAGSVGWPAPGVEISIRRDDGTECDPGEVGEVCLRGRHMYAGYILAEGFRARPADAFHATGDVGYLDPRDGLHLKARRHDIIKTGGYKVFPQEVEESPLREMGAGEILVVGLPSEYWGEVILVASEGPADEWETLVRKAAEQLTSYKRPRLFVSLPALPRNATGKLDRKRLRDMVLERYHFMDGPHPRLDLIA